MTKIQYDRKDNQFSLLAQGHAGFADVGNDIVCAGISTLTQTLVYHLIDNSKSFAYTIHPGELWVYGEGENEVIYSQVIVTGLKALEAEFPTNLEVTEGCTIINKSPLQ